ncbi:ATPase-like protein [Nakamurella multipartita DSM 44233]|uniref:ATPase-like protein n=2 Tax=Nakamurella TaxID=53460 RepID=C8X6S9_NAKMY|nr:ATPase-like protein [Nakamurella multipartita DSM 44233]
MSMTLPGTGQAGADALIGREAELDRIRQVLEAARTGRPTIALLMGEAGIGKTRLADEASRLARAVGLRVLRGESDASSRRPMQLWREVDRALGLAVRGDPALPVGERRWEHLEALADALAAGGPSLVVLEDLHWADPIAIWVLERLPRALGEAPVALLATSRDHEPDTPAIDGLRRVARPIRLGGLDIDGVRRLVAQDAAGSQRPVDAIDPAELLARTGGNPLLVKELVRAPSGDAVIGQVLRRSLARFAADTRNALTVAAVGGPGAPLSVLAAACACPADELAARLRPAVVGGVLDAVSADGVRFHHALLAEAAQQDVDLSELHGRLAAAWRTVGGIDGRAASVGHGLRAAVGSAEDATGEAAAATVDQARLVAVELITAGAPARAAELLWEARETAGRWAGRPELRANVAVDLADILSWLGDLEPALGLYQEAAELARTSADPVARARAEIGANLWASAFVPDLARMRRLEDALDALPAQERRLRAALLGRLTIIGGADVEATERVAAWSAEAVAVARSLADPELIAELLLDSVRPATSPTALAAAMVATDEAIRLAERAGRSDLAISGHQRRSGLLLNDGDIGGAGQALGRAEVLAALLPSPWWRYITRVQRTTLLALNGSLLSARASMLEAVEVGSGRIEPVVVLGCEALHQLMLFDLYGRPDPRAEEIHRITMDMLGDVPSPVFQVQKGYGAQLFGDPAGVQEVLHRFGSRPEQLLRSWTGDHLLREFSDIVARAGAAGYATPAYRALLPYAGLLNVGGGHSAGLPVDDVLARLALLAGDPAAAVRHAGDAVALARSMPSPPLLVHCLDHLADAVDAAGEGPAQWAPDVLRAEADALALTIEVRRADRPADRAGMPSGVPAGPAGTASMRRDGSGWLLRTPLGDARLLDSPGPGQLARLLRAPGVEVAAVELAGGPGAPAATDLGPALDAQAKREYRRRLHRLQAEVDEADAGHEVVRAERAHAEMEMLLRELRRAVGLGSRDRPTGSDAERARVNVVRNLRRTIAAIGRQAPLLGAHLDDAVRTGRHCLYLPTPGAALTWSVRADAD